MLKQIEKMTLWLSIHCNEKEKEFREELKEIADDNGIIFNVICLGGPTQLHVFRRHYDFLSFDNENKIQTFIDFLKTEQKEKERLLVEATRGGK